MDKIRKLLSGGVVRATKVTAAPKDTPVIKESVDEQDIKPGEDAAGPAGVEAAEAGEQKAEARPRADAKGKSPGAAKKNEVVAKGSRKK